MASPELPPGREFRQMRHDVDDAYRLLTDVQKTVESTRVVVGTVSSAQQRHERRLDEIQHSLDRQATRIDLIDDAQSRQADRLGRIEGVQQRQGKRLDQVEDRLGRIEGVQQQQGGYLEEILTLLRGRSSS